MPNPKDIAVFVGSLRKESFTRKVALAMAKIAPATMKLSIVEVGHLGPYNQDLDPNPPADWTALKERIQKADAVLFATPEYNRSVPGFFKNVIDIASRPYGKSAWDGKPAAIVSVSPGAIGGFGANHHLRQSLVFLNMPTMPQPEAYVGGAAQLIGADGDFAKPETKEFLGKFLAAFDRWIDRNAPAK
ncbi:MAG TPA: NAD(P)H-dependent oxidoreductase [Stellaceae bacterium]